jgi:hypothetical protein
MDLILLVGPQAVGKMTVGIELEKRIDARLLFNHQTLDLFANFLHYTADTFRLSDMVRTELFQSFVKHPETNATKGIIFTVVVAFDKKKEWTVLKDWISIFTEAGGNVYFVELEATLEERLKRNVSDNRLEAKPSKRNIDFSRQELLHSAENHRLNSVGNEVQENLPDVRYLKVQNTELTAEETAEKIEQWMKKEGYQKDGK